MVPANNAHGKEGGSLLSIKDVSPSMMGLTWLTFILMTVILYKVAWKPILKALDMREESIRRALEDAEKARKETADLEARQKQILKDSEAEAQAMIANARVAARQTAEMIEARASRESRELIENAKKEISSATEKARTELRRESAELTIALATKVIGENMDSDKNRVLIEKMIKET